MTSRQEMLTRMFFEGLSNPGYLDYQDLTDEDDTILRFMSSDWNWIKRNGPPPRSAGEIDPMIWKYSSLPQDAEEALLWFRLVVRAMYFDMSAREYLQVVSALWMRAGYEAFGKRLQVEALHLGEEDYISSPHD